MASKIKKKRKQRVETKPEGNLGQKFNDCILNM